jgi:16S rRNA G966 N2-methylase RsmD
LVDLHRQAIKTIQRNLEETKLKNGAEVIQRDAFKLLGQESDRQFDYVYIAPPQYKEMWKKALCQVDACPEWLSEDAWVIVQIHPVEFVPVELENLLEFDQRRYGSTILIFYSLED